LNASAATALGTVLHELATNTAKYGALSVPDGWVEATWTAPEDAEPRLRFLWSERGGPEITQKISPGFGTSFITRVVEYELQGTTNLELLPEGLRCTIEFPLSRAANRTTAAQ
jgi:two-component sensor histidine kinase